MAELPENSELKDSKKELTVNIEEELEHSYMDYAMSVIIGRALPDVRDGLKPVHRRCLFAMSELSNNYNLPYKKSARVVGDVIGKYHPHGDTAVYDTIVRMAQEFSLRNPLVDGQGNFGSIDGDSAAAMRYTEIRLQKLSHELLDELDKDTVDYAPNYDGSLQEPTVLPARFPNLLINGSSGIAVGMATNMPPHNLGEIIRACIAVINRPALTFDELCTIVPGPDFPTGGELIAGKELRQAYETGRGVVPMRGALHVERLKGDRYAVVITEIPYQVNKLKLVEKIAELVNERKIEGISDLRDESNREGIRVVIELKKEVKPADIVKVIRKQTQFETSFGIINLAVVAGMPKVLSLRELIDNFIAYRKEVVTRRTRFELKKAADRLHILEGLLKALDQIDAVIAAIRAARDPEAARNALMLQFGFTDVQARAILAMRLQRLTGLERKALQEEAAQLERLVAKLQRILSSRAELQKVIVNELEALVSEYATPRRTRIVSVTDTPVEAAVASEDGTPVERVAAKKGKGALLPDIGTVVEPMAVIISDGRVSRKPWAQWEAETVGQVQLLAAASAPAPQVLRVDDGQILAAVTNYDKLHHLQLMALPLDAKTAPGAMASSLSQFGTGESPLAYVSFSESDSLLFVTRTGSVKRTMAEEYLRGREGGVIATKTENGDKIVALLAAKADDILFIGTAMGQSICFAVNDLRPQGRVAGGVCGIKLADGDEVISAHIVTAGFAGTVITVTAGGFAKQTPYSEFVTQGRAGKGIVLHKLSPATGKLIDAVVVEPGTLSFVLGGCLVNMQDIPAQGRGTSGKKVFDAIVS